MAQHSLVRTEASAAPADIPALPNPRGLAIVSAVTMAALICSVVASIIYAINTIDHAAIGNEMERAERALSVAAGNGAAPDAALALRLDEDFLLRGARFVAPKAAAAEEATVAVPGHPGLVLAWSPRRFASEMALGLTPIRLAATLAFMLGIGLVLRRLYAVATDLDRRRREAQEIAVHDTLTGAGNRLAFEQRLANDCGDGAALLYLDLDEFKQVNDRLGHGAGDELLRVVARRIAALGGEGDLVARLGGDEFVLLRCRAASRDELADLATAIGTALAQPVEVGGTRLAVGVSIGIAVLPPASRDPSRLVAAADAALYKAKAMPGHAFVFADDPDLKRAA